MPALRPKPTAGSTACGKSNTSKQLGKYTRVDYTAIMKVSTLFLIVLGVLAGAWALSLIYKLSAWLSTFLTYAIAIAMVVGLVWLFIVVRRKAGRKKADEDS